MEKNLEDRILVCKDCKRKFTFAVREQEFFGQKGYKDPVRCKYCRRQKSILKALEDGVPISDEIRFTEICETCNRKFYTKYKRKRGEKVYCDDCWSEIKGV